MIDIVKRYNYYHNIFLKNKNYGMVGVNIMEKKTKRISFNQLEEGMIVAKNVEQNGIILLKKDIPITEQMIKKMQKLIFYWKCRSI